MTLPTTCERQIVPHSKLTSDEDVLSVEVEGFGEKWRALGGNRGVCGELEGSGGYSMEGLDEFDDEFRCSDDVNSLTDQSVSDAEGEVSLEGMSVMSHTEVLKRSTVCCWEGRGK